MIRILEGDLSRLEIPDVLTFLNLGRRTGVLALEKSDQETKLFLREGNPVYASSTKEELRLGTMMVRLGKVKAETVERALSRRRTGRWRIGHFLLSEKLVTEHELASFLKVQVSEVIFDTFGWKSGVFSFWENVPPPATAVTLEMDLHNLLMEGSRRLDERSRLTEAFPDLDVSVEAVANPERVKQAVTMTPEEWKVFFLVDGRRTVSEICRLAGNPDEMATLLVLYHLMTANLVAVMRRLPGAATADESPLTTFKVLEAPSSPSPARPVSVEFQTPARAKNSEDDTKEIVNPLAVQYTSNRESVMAIRLVLIGPGGETSFPLTRDAYTIGRHRNNDVMVSDPKVSSFHARLDRQPDGFLLVDLKSRNGSYVNGKKVENSVLKSGDEIRMGTARLIYKLDYTAPVS